MQILFTNTVFDNFKKSVIVWVSGVANKNLDTKLAILENKHCLTMLSISATLLSNVEKYKEFELVTAENFWELLRITEYSRKLLSIAGNTKLLKITENWWEPKIAENY